MKKSRFVLVAVAVVALGGLAIVTTARAATISFEVDASQDTDGDGRWEDLAPGTPSGFDFELDTANGVARVASGSSMPGITYAYDFPGGFTDDPNPNVGGALLSTAGTSTRRSFLNATGDWSNESVSMEMWFKPDNIAPTPANGQILFEDGGGTGFGFFIDDNKVEYRRASTTAQTDRNISSIADEFIQVVGTYDFSSGAMVLYVNGTQQDTATSGGSKWTGGDAAGVGTRGGSNTGGIGNGQSSTESFDGRIAIFRVYRDQVLTPAEVLASYKSTARRVQALGWTGVQEGSFNSGTNFYGVLTDVGTADDGIGTTSAGTVNGDTDGNDTDNDTNDTVGWAVGDFVLEGTFTAAQEPAVDTVLAVMDLTIPAGATDIDLTLTFTQDMEGTLESDDSLRFEIYDAVGETVLSSLTLADDGVGTNRFSYGDTTETLTSLDNVGLTDVQARLIYSGGGWSGGDQEEVQIGDPVFTATYVPEPSTLAVVVLGLMGVSIRRRRGR